MPMLPGMSIRKVGATLLPTSSTVYNEEEKPRGRAVARNNYCKNVAIVALGLCLFVVSALQFGGVVDLCGRSGGGGENNYILEKSSNLDGRSGPKVTLSYFAFEKKSSSSISSSDGELEEIESGSNLVEIVESADGKRSQIVRPKVLGLVGIQTGFDSGSRRKALRETWFPSTPEGLLRLEKDTGLAFRFVIGHTADPRRMKALEEEVAEHKDFMLIDVDEQYQKLTLKTLAFFRTAYALFKADFYVKADDDIYLRPDRLAVLLSQPRTSPRTYLGCLKKGPVITDPKLKWFEPKSYMLGGEYFLHAYGPIYALSSEVVESLSPSKFQRYRMFMNEDVTIGVWMLAMDVEHEDNRAICDTSCNPTSIAVWDLPRCSGLCNPTERMRELHKEGMCSKSPT